MTRLLLVIIAIWTLQLASRGLDYLLGNPDTGVGVFTVSDVYPPVAWGVACLVAASILAAGLVRRSLCLIRNGAVLAAVIYTAFAVLVSDEVFLGGAVDDWRFLTGYLATAGLWGVIAYALTIRAAVEDNRRRAGSQKGE